MKVLKLLFVFTLWATISYAQVTAPIKVYVIKAVKDSFQVKESGYTYKNAITSNTDTAVYGTDLYNNIITVKTDIDSVKIKFNPKYEPLEQKYQVNIISPRYHTVIYYIYHEMRNKFSAAYMKKAGQAPQYEIPETYELANVIYALTKSSDNNKYRTLKTTPYFKQVQAYFSKYKSHPLFSHLQFDDDKEGIQNYYNFRENSFCYLFAGNKMTRNQQYNIVWGAIEDNLFKRLLPLINDFANKSRFREFYKSNRKYYESLIADEKKFMPVSKMQVWLEKNFRSKIQSYKVIFSPLILGSHSTQMFSWIENINTGFFKESVMFVSSMQTFSLKDTVNDKRKEGLASGIVFTEIDHNYCNPVSDKYSKQINEALSNRKLWIAKNGDGEIYETPVSIFNEYITHGVFVLYCYDTFKDQDDFKAVKQNREYLMVNRRKYLQFESFDGMLLDLYQNKNPAQAVSDLYPAIIAWCKVHNSGKQDFN